MATVLDQLYNAFERYGPEFDLTTTIILDSDRVLEQQQSGKVKRAIASEVDVAFAWERHKPSSRTQQKGVTTDLYRGDGELSTRSSKRAVQRKHETDLYRGGIGLNDVKPVKGDYAPAHETNPWEAETTDDVVAKVAAAKRTSQKPAPTAWERTDDAISRQQSRQIQQKTGTRRSSRNPILDGGDDSISLPRRHAGEYNPQRQAFL
eukprot:TRINITY_DN8347_c0_g1_i1.p2 TRINITY_DN8347_c0_g1~~TRINITY_DN8347_c0_g1_i1.p2  ORF type:complete len:206 (+),score=25.52 TRINITY_DN8347_c0_g1_i1:61-678(+)